MYKRIVMPRAYALSNAKWAVLLSLVALLGQQALADGRGPAWPVHVIDSGLSGGDGVRLLDVDNDGDMDLAVGWEQSGVTRLYLNPGPVPEVRDNWPSFSLRSASYARQAWCPAQRDEVGLFVLCRLQGSAVGWGGQLATVVTGNRVLRDSQINWQEARHCLAFRFTLEK